MLKLMECSQESLVDLFGATVHGCRVRDAPVGRDGVSRPHRTCFARCAIANCHDQIHVWCIGACKGLPRLTGKIGSLKSNLLQHLQGYGVDFAFGMTSGAKST